MLSKMNASARKRTYISALFSIFAVSILALAGSAPELNPNALPSAVSLGEPAYTLSTTRTITEPDGSLHLLSSEQRFQRTDGIYKLVQTQYGSNGTTERVETLLGFIGLGVFRVDEAKKRLVFAGLQVDDRPANIEQSLRESELFTRDEQVAGTNTIVWRLPGRGKQDFVEQYRAPSLGGLLIKTVKVSPRGSEVVEPTDIKIGEPAIGLFSELLSYRVDYSRYEQELLETEKGDAEIAHSMRQLLERMKQAKP